MRIAVTSFTIFLNFILQSTLFEYIEIFSVRPNTMLIIIVSFSLLRFDVEGAIIGFFAGLLQDIMYGKVIGLHALLYMTIGYFCGKPFKDFYRENYLLPLLLVIGSSLFYEVSYYLTNFLFINRLDLIYYIRKIIIPVVCYNALLTVSVYRLIYSINDFLEIREKPKRKLF